MKNQVVYLSGPISCLPRQVVIEAFAAASKLALEEGYVDYYNPTTDVMNMRYVKQFDAGLIDGEELWQLCMRVCIQVLVHSEVIWMLPGWKKSRGARIEHNLALDLNMEIKYL